MGFIPSKEPSLESSGKLNFLCLACNLYLTLQESTFVMMFLKKEAPNFFIFLRLDNENGDGQNGHNMVHIKNTPKIINVYLKAFSDD